jgi:signal transduction histidine kinase
MDQLPYDLLSRKFEAHERLDCIFSESCAVETLPEIISQVGSQLLNCAFISIWTYNPGENLLENLVARGLLGLSIDAGPSIPVGKVRIPLRKGPGAGILSNVASLIIEGRHLKDLPTETYIVNNRLADPRHAERSGFPMQGTLRSAMYAPMIFEGFKGMMIAYNQREHNFTPLDYEILEILARKTAIVIDNIRMQKKYDEAARMAVMGRSVDLVRHELAAPLTVIKAGSHIIKKTIEREQLTGGAMQKIAEIAGMIEREIDRNARLLEEIRLYCAPEMSLSLSPGDIEKTLGESIEDIRAFLDTFGTGAARLLYAPAGISKKVNFSKEHLLQALRNLVRNSLQHGTSMIRIATAPCIVERGEVDVDGVAVSVEDRAGGVAESLLANLGNPYSSSRREVGGSGLGLFITRRIIEEGHSGVLAARNVYEKGTRTGLIIEARLPLA